MPNHASDTPPGIAPVTAVVLAGGDRGDRLAAGAGVAAKALVPIDGRPMGAYVLHALRECAAVQRTVYVGPTNGQLSGLSDVELPSGERLVDSLTLGFGAALGSGASSVLLLSADIPWVDGAMITRFLEACAAAGPADVYYPVVREEISKARYPDHERTFVKLRDGRFTGANLAFVGRSGVAALLPLVDRLYRGRKNPFALAAMMGFDVLASLLLGTASIDRLERRASELLGRTVKAVISADAELAADVDRPSHLPGVLDPELPTRPHEPRLVAVDGLD
ncbi:MAG TPA: NTP transferase domain-containing protein [Trueperaceae bacterium]|nr:NTP transferase domain-containing protein [Trueperaceae bacterium]